MTSSLLRRPIIAALALLAVVLMGLIALEAGFGARLGMSTAAPPPRHAAPTEAGLLPPLAPVIPEQAYAQVTERPLFTPTRRPAPPEAVSGKPAFNKGQFVLQGVIVVGEGRTALLREVTSGRIHRVERGKDVNGIKVEKIEATEVTLTLGGEKETVALLVQRPAGASPAAASAPQGPFGALLPAAAVATTAAPATPSQNVPNASGLASAPVSGAARGPSPGTAETARVPATSSTQPMSPEELLARRRARRNQPTQ